MSIVSEGGASGAVKSTCQKHSTIRLKEYTQLHRIGAPFGKTRLSLCSTHQQSMDSTPHGHCADLRQSHGNLRPFLSKRRGGGGGGGGSQIAAEPRSLHAALVSQASMQKLGMHVYASDWPIPIAS